MTLTTSSPPLRSRAAFTLVELLVVISIIAVLLALTSVALQKTVERQRNKTTKENVYKLQQSLDTEYERVVRECEADQRKPGGIPKEVIDYADGNKDRALAIWTALQLRRQFPDNFYEATYGMPINGGAYTLKHHAVFNEVAGLGSAANPPAPHPDEAAVLLYIILAKKSVSGGGAMANAADDLSLQRTVTIGGKQFTTFMDAWDNSITFNRWEQGYDTQAQEYRGSANSAGNNDPLDPRNLILGWSPDPQNKKAQMNSLFSFNGRNRLPTVIALGKDKTRGTADDILGYQVKRFGK